MRRKGTALKGEQRRQRALQWLQRGEKLSVVAQLLGVSKRSVFRWQAAYRRDGKQGLTRKSPPGRNSKLSLLPHGERRLVSWLKSGQFARPLFYRGEPTARNIAEFIWRYFGVQYHPNHIGRLLGRLGGVYKPQVGWEYQPERKREYKNSPGRPSKLSEPQKRRLVEGLEERLKWLEEAWKSRERKLRLANAYPTTIEKLWVAERREVWCTPRIIQRLIEQMFSIECEVVTVRRLLRQRGWRWRKGFGWVPGGKLPWE